MKLFMKLLSVGYVYAGPNVRDCSNSGSGEDQKFSVSDESHGSVIVALDP